MSGPSLVEDQNPYGIKTVLDWSDERRYEGGNIMVTLTYGYAFDAGDQTAEGSHVRGFNTVAEAKRGTRMKAVEKCKCPRCEEGLMRQEIARMLEDKTNTPEADGFRSFPEWMEIQDSVKTLI